MSDKHTTIEETISASGYDDSISLKVSDITSTMIRIWAYRDTEQLSRTIEKYAKWLEKNNYTYNAHEDAIEDATEILDFFAFLADMPYLKHANMLPNKEFGNEWELYEKCKNLTIGPCMTFMRSSTEVGYYREQTDAEPEPSPRLKKKLAKNGELYIHNHDILPNNPKQVIQSPIRPGSQ